MTANTLLLSFLHKLPVNGGWKESNFLTALYANEQRKYRATEKFLKVPQITFVR